MRATAFRAGRLVETGPDGVAEAKEEGQAVGRGVLEVRARPWVVVFTGSSLT